MGGAPAPAQGARPPLPCGTRDEPAANLTRVRVAFVNSGLGLLAPAEQLRRLVPTADLVLSMDPDGMPWGPRTPADITARTLACARAALARPVDAIVVACNSASVHALDAVRAAFEPAVPVIGTVPAVKPAARAGGRVASWATVATTGSAYQHRLVTRFAPGRDVALVACPGLAAAVDAGDAEAVAREVRTAVAATPADVTDLVLGCTEYELVADLIGARMPGVRLRGTAAAVAAQVLRRLAGHRPEPGRGRLDVVLSGRPGTMPAAASRYPAGRALGAAAIAS